MKRMQLMTALLLALASGLTARADWSDMRAGLDEKATLAAVGAPIIASRSKSRVQATWTYDAGGYIQFERGRVAHWQVPKNGGATIAVAGGAAGAVAAPGTAMEPKRGATRRLVIVR